MIAEFGTDVTAWRGGKGLKGRGWGVVMLSSKGAQSCVHLSSQSVLFSQVPVINVPTYKRHAGYPDDCSSMQKPSDDKVILTGPATLNDETDVRMTFNVM